jgi:hypothetical protein
MRRSDVSGHGVVPFVHPLPSVYRTPFNVDGQTYWHVCEVWNEEDARFADQPTEPVRGSSDPAKVFCMHLVTPSGAKIFPSVERVVLEIPLDRLELPHRAKASR